MKAISRYFVGIALFVSLLADIAIIVLCLLDTKSFTSQALLYSLVSSSVVALFFSFVELFRLKKEKSLYLVYLCLCISHLNLWLYFYSANCLIEYIAIKNNMLFFYMLLSASYFVLFLFAVIASGVKSKGFKIFTNILSLVSSTGFMALLVFLALSNNSWLFGDREIIRLLSYIIIPSSLGLVYLCLFIGEIPLLVENAKIRVEKEETPISESPLVDIDIGDIDSLYQTVKEKLNNLHLSGKNDNVKFAKEDELFVDSIYKRILKGGHIDFNFEESRKISLLSKDTLRGYNDSKRILTIMGFVSYSKAQEYYSMRRAINYLVNAANKYDPVALYVLASIFSQRTCKSFVVPNNLYAVHCYALSYIILGKGEDYFFSRIKPYQDLNDIDRYQTGELVSCAYAIKILKNNLPIEDIKDLSDFRGLSFEDREALRLFLLNTKDGTVFYNEMETYLKYILFNIILKCLNSYDFQEIGESMNNYL